MFVDIVCIYDLDSKGLEYILDMNFSTFGIIPLDFNQYTEY